MRLPSSPRHVGPIDALSASAARQALSTFGTCALLSFSLLTSAPAIAKTDGAAIGSCLITKAPLPLAKCVTNPVCAANLLCIQTCTNRPDEATCQIKCGDEFANGVTEEFTRAAVTETKCVPQRENDGSYPVPQPSALVKDFKTTPLEGDWYISAGFNKAFDTFDCQLHKFEAPSPTTLVGNLQWRIKDPVAGSNFVTRYTVQTFYQDKEQPGILYNHDNEFLHYQDDWYILGYEQDKYFVVYYRGTNDAWDGYGGAVVYTRSPTLPKEYIPAIKKALEPVNIRWEDFQLTDNSCRASETKIEELEADLQFVETKVARGLLLAEQSIVEEVVEIEKEVVKDVKLAEKVVEEDIVKVEKEVVKDLNAVEKTVEDDLTAVEKIFSSPR